MKKFLLRLVYYLQLHHLMRYLCRNRIIIIMYHGFTDKDRHEGIENYRSKHIKHKAFRAQMQYLKKYYNVISLEKLISHYTDGEPLPNNSVVITIDDGYQSNYTLAYPILHELKLPATIFIAADFVEKQEPLWTDRVEFALNNTKLRNYKLAINSEVLQLDLRDTAARVQADLQIRQKLKSIPQQLREHVIENLESGLGQKLSQAGSMPEMYRPLQWDQVTEMLNSGLITIGSHTLSHVILPRCTEERIKKELVASRQLIEKNVGTNCNMFCYPNGDFNDVTTKIVKETGYNCALTTLEGMNNSLSDRYKLKRTGIMMRDSLVEFIMTLTGIQKFLIDSKHAVERIFSSKKLNPSQNRVETD